MSEIERTSDGQVRFKQSAEAKAKNAAVMQKEQDRLAAKEAKDNERKLAAKKAQKRQENIGLYALAAIAIQVALAGLVCWALYSYATGYNPTPSPTPLTMFAGLCAGLIVSSIIGKASAIPGIFIYDADSDYAGRGTGPALFGLLLLVAIAAINVWSFVILFS